MKQVCKCGNDKFFVDIKNSCSGCEQNYCVNSTCEKHENSHDCKEKCANFEGAAEFDGDCREGSNNNEGCYLITCPCGREIDFSPLGWG